MAALAKLAPVMDFTLSEEQQAFRELAQDFAENELAPFAAAWGPGLHLPVDALRKAAALGLGGIYVAMTSADRTSRGSMPR